MPEFDISIVKIAQTTEDFHITTKNKKEAEKLAIQAAKKTEFSHGEPDIITDMIIECKGE